MYLEFKFPKIGIIKLIVCEWIIIMLMFPFMMFTMSENAYIIMLDTESVMLHELTPKNLSYIGQFVFQSI